MSTCDLSFMLTPRVRFTVLKSLECEVLDWSLYDAVSNQTVRFQMAECLVNNLIGILRALTCY